MATVFRGFNEFFEGDKTSKNKQKIPDQLTIPAQVIEICLDNESKLYETEVDIGKIKFRNLTKELNSLEKSINNFAYPLDRSTVKYPLPGEEVLVFKLLGESVRETAQEESIQAVYYYTNVVSVLQNITYNSHPFLGTTSLAIDPKKFSITTEEHSKRFEKKMSDIDSVLDADRKPLMYKQLKPYQGDFILQGRFGNSIRFGSTNITKEQPWTDFNEVVSKSGDGIMVLRVDNESTSKVDEMFAIEDFATDASSIYLTTTQTLPVKLAWKDNYDFKSWMYDYNIGNVKIKDPTGGDKADLLVKVQDDEKVTGNPASSETTPGTLDNDNIAKADISAATEEARNAALGSNQVAGVTVINVPQLDSPTYKIPDNSYKLGTKAPKKLDPNPILIKDGKNNYQNGSQILLHSDRVILNSKTSHLLLFGNEGVAIASPGKVNIDALDDITLYSNESLFLGVPGRLADVDEEGIFIGGNKKVPTNKAQATLDEDYEPLVLGLKLANLIEDLIITISNAALLTPVGVGYFREDVKDELTRIKARIPEMLSTYGFIDGVSHEAVDPAPIVEHPVTQPPTTLVGVTISTIPDGMLGGGTSVANGTPALPIDTTIHPLAAIPGYFTAP